MIDLTYAKKLQKGYGGANGNKISVIYKGERWMIKFPPRALKNPDIRYSNSCICEYLGSSIFDIIGIPVQDTFLAKYQVLGVDKIVVACKDFVREGEEFQDFASLKNQIIDSEKGGYGTELSDIEKALETQDLIDSHVLKNRFWDMFIVDSMIGNWDRHNGNWGFLYNSAKDSSVLAPVFDCGSSLYPQADIKLKKLVLSDKNEMNARIFSFPTSAITENDKRINYNDFISSLKNDDCNKAMLRITPRIDLKKIGQMIDKVPCITDIEKEFYFTMVAKRKELILDKSLKKYKQKIRSKDIKYPDIAKNKDMDNILNKLRSKKEDPER